MNITEFLYDGLQVLQEITGENRQKKTMYYRAKGRIITQQKYKISRGNNDSYQRRPNRKQLYYTYDGLGSVASLANHKGKKKTHYQYDVFGKVVSGDLSNNPYAFTGKRFDAESGFYQFHFRQYDPGTGVWITPDPIGIMGGINLYSYVSNNPVNLIDQLGLHGSDFGGPGAMGVGGETNEGDSENSDYLRNPDKQREITDDFLGLLMLEGLIPAGGIY